MNKINYLDGLRGLAALVVVINHFVVAFYPALYNGNINESHTSNALEVFISKSPVNLVYNGNFAVCIFFVLSGYVLSYKFFKTKNVDVLLSGAIRRYLRLVIPVLFSVIIVYIFMRYSLFYNKEAGVISNSGWWLSTFWNFETSIKDLVKYAFIDVFFGYSDKYNTVLWTMTYEYFGSLLVFGIALFFGRIKHRYVIYFVLVVYFLNSYYLAFIIGMILSDLINNGKYIINKVNNKWVNLTILLVGLYFGSYPSGVPVDNTIYDLVSRIGVAVNPVSFWHIIGAGLIIISVLNAKRLQEFFSRSIFIFLGKISFSMYLLHVIIIGSFTSYLMTLLVEFLPYNISVLISSVLSMIIIIFFAYGMFKYVDSNGIRLSNYFYKNCFLNIFSIKKEREKMNKIS